MQWFRHKFLALSFSVLFTLGTGSMAIAANEFRDVANEIETISVLSESDISLPMSQISSLFTQGRPISVACNFGDSAVQKKKIEDGEAADVFITSQADLVQDLKTKGLVDIYSIGQIAAQGEKAYTIAVVAGENMTPARVFLEFLKSSEAKEVFKKNGFIIP